jgi:RimJ/RimL family protein N-acetyltransferase
MLKCIPYKPGHLDLLTIKEIHSSEAEGMEARVNATAAMPCSHTQTIIAEGRPIALVGLTVFRPRVAEVWAVMGEEIRLYPIAATRTVRKLVDTYERQLGLQRMQMMVKEDHPEAQRFAELMGFEKEGVFRKYGHDQANYGMFARVA